MRGDGGDRSTQRARKIYLNVSENKSSDRKLSLISEESLPVKNCLKSVNIWQCKNVVVSFVFFLLISARDNRVLALPYSPILKQIFTDRLVTLPNI